jgi:hypothetical protein
MERNFKQLIIQQLYHYQQNEQSLQNMLRFTSIYNKNTHYRHNERQNTYNTI